MNFINIQEGTHAGQMDAQSYFNRIYSQTNAELTKLVVIKTSNADQVEDILQNVYQEFYARILRKGFADIRQPAAFLNKLAHQELSRHYQRKAMRQQREIDLEGYDDLVDDTIPFDSLLETREQMQHVAHLVKQLPLYSYKSFVLFYYYDMPISGIARQIGISESNVKDRLWRSRNALRKALLVAQNEK